MIMNRSAADRLKTYPASFCRRPQVDIVISNFSMAPFTIKEK